MKAITKNDEIEFIFKNLPESIPYLMKKGVCGINCGQPRWGTLQFVSTERGFSDSDIDLMIKDLNIMLLLVQV
jgi:hypothetical protein